MDADDFISHYGKKGMRWGVRRAAKKTAKADKKWEKKANTLKTYIAVHNEAARVANKIDVPRINNNPKYKDKDFTFDSPLRRKYYKEHEDAFNKRRQEAADKLVGSNPSGTKKIKIYSDGSAGLVAITHSSISSFEHESDEPKVVLIFNNLGHIVEFKIVEDSLEQAFSAEEFIAHYGKKGMKWGVRKSGASKVGASKDAKRAGTTLKKAKSNSVKSLTNKEIKELTARIELERKYSSLNPSKVKKGHDAVKGVLAVGATVNTAIAFANSPVGRALRMKFSP